MIDQLKVKLYYVAQAWHESASIASLAAPYVARILDRKCQHNGMYCLYMLVFRDGGWDRFPPDSILFGNSIVWKTGAIQVVQYAVEQITEDDLALGDWVEWRMWIAHCRKQLDSGYDVTFEHQPRFWRYGKTIPLTPRMIELAQSAKVQLANNEGIQTWKSI